MGIDFEYLKNLVDIEKKNNKNPLNILYSFVCEICKNGIGEDIYGYVFEVVDYIIQNEVPLQYKYISNIIKSLVEMVFDTNGVSNYVDTYLCILADIIVSNEENLFRDYDLLTLGDVVFLINIHNYDIFVNTLESLISMKYDFVDLLDEYIDLKKDGMCDIDNIIKKINISIFINKYKDKNKKIVLRRCFEYIVKLNEKISSEIIYDVVINSREYSWVLSGFANSCSKEDGLILMYYLLKDTKYFLSIYSVEDKINFYFDKLFKMNKNIHKGDVLNYDTTHLFLKCLKNEEMLYM